MRSYITALMLLATLGLVSCGGGNEGASTGTPVVAQATLWSPYANGGCANSQTFEVGSGPALTQAQQTACTNALTNASNMVNPVSAYAQCNALGGCYNGNYNCVYAYQYSCQQ
jgi:hypothetical protein